MCFGLLSHLGVSCLDEEYIFGLTISPALYRYRLSMISSFSPLTIVLNSIHPSTHEHTTLKSFLHLLLFRNAKIMSIYLLLVDYARFDYVSHVPPIEYLNNDCGWIM